MANLHSPWLGSYLFLQLLSNTTFPTWPGPLITFIIEHPNIMFIIAQYSKYSGSNHIWCVDSSISHFPLYRALFQATFDLGNEWDAIASTKALKSFVCLQSNFWMKSWNVPFARREFIEEDCVHLVSIESMSMGMCTQNLKAYISAIQFNIYCNGRWIWGEIELTTFGWVVCISLHAFTYTQNMTSCSHWPYFACRSNFIVGT